MMLQGNVLVPATADQLKNIKNELGEDDNKLATYVLLFNEWLKCEPHLPTEVETTIIENYIRHSKFDLQRAKDKFEKYLIAKERFPTFYNREFKKEHFEKNVLHRCSFVLPQLTPEGYRIFMMVPNKEVENFDAQMCNIFSLMLCDYLIYNDYNAGLVFVIDLKNLSIQHLTRTPIKMFTDFIRIAISVLPTRIRQIHIFNMNPVAETFVSICKALLSQKLKNRLLIHKGYIIDGYLTKEVMPIDFGGLGENLDSITTKWRQHIENNEKWLQEMNSLQLTGGVPQNKKNIYYNQEFGVNGCFRQLQLD